MIRYSDGVEIDSSGRTLLTYAMERNPPATECINVSLIKGTWNSMGKKIEPWNSTYYPHSILGTGRVLSVSTDPARC